MADRDAKVKLELGYDIARTKVSLGVELTNLSFLRPRNAIADAWRRERIVSQAKKDARRNIPAATAIAEGTETERDILSRRETEFQAVKDAILQRRDKVNRSVLEARPPLISADGEISKVRGQLEKLRTFYLDIYQNDQDYRDSYANVQKFKKEHSLDRDARIPEYRSQVLAVILSVMFAETLANGYIFSGISAQGFIGGWTLAVALSIINVGGGISAGYFLFRRIRFSGLTFKISSVAACIALLLFNLFAAHFRIFAEDHGGHGSVQISPNEVFQQMVFQPLAFTSRFPSLGLFFLGISIAVFAIFDGYQGITDKYPGYGTVWREYQSKRKLRSERLKEYKLKAHNYIDAVATYAGVIEVITRHFETEVEKAISSFDILTERSNTWLNKLNSVTEAHISAYRNANSRERNRLLKIQGGTIRKGKSVDFTYTTAPAYFEEPIKLNSLAFENASQTTETWGGTLEIIKKNIAELSSFAEKLEDVRKQIDQAIQQSLDAAKASENRVLEDVKEIRAKLIRAIQW